MKVSFFRWCGSLFVLSSVCLITTFAQDKNNPKMRPQVVLAPLTASVVAEAVRSEQDAFFRRLEICDRLRNIGEETNNSNLVQQADELQKQVTAIYSARVSRLGVKTPKTLDTELAQTSVDGKPVSPPAPTAKESN